MNIYDIKNLLNDELLNNFTYDEIKTYKHTKNQYILRLLKSKYSYLQNVNEIAYLIKHKNNLENLHIFCPVCGKKNKFINFNEGYKKYCCKKCYWTISYHNYIVKHPEFLKIVRCQCCNKDFIPTKEHIIKWMNRESHNKCLYITCSKHCTLVLTQAKIDKQMVKEKRWKTLEEKTGNKNYRNLEQGRKTLFENHGVIHNSKIPGFSEQVKYTKFLNHGDENYNNINAIKNTIHQRYNVSWNSQTESWKLKMKLNKNKRVQKCYESYKKNSSFKSVSKPELRTFYKLLTKFNDTIHTYRDNDRYPFNCDFYIPSKDLFIECHYGLFHNFKPFDTTNKEHLEELDKLRKLAEEKRKTKKLNRYDGIIYSWTILDPKKLKTFQDNHLNYKIFYTEKEFDEWFKNL